MIKVDARILAAVATTQGTTDREEYNFKCVRFDKNCIVAINGPMITVAENGTPIDGQESYFISDEIKEMLIQPDVFEVVFDFGLIYLKRRDGSDFFVTACAAIEDPYPDWRSLIPAKMKGKSKYGCLSVQMLKQVIKVAEILKETFNDGCFSLQILCDDKQTDEVTARHTVTYDNNHDIFSIFAPLMKDLAPSYEEVYKSVMMH